jgi:hypothetical protein
MDELVAHRRESLERLTTRGLPVTIGAKEVRGVDLTALSVAKLAQSAAR